MTTAAAPLSLQENILTVLCFSDTSAGVVAGLVRSEVFDNEIYRRVADKAIRYYDRYKKAPKQHIADLLEKEVEGDRRSAAAYKQVLKDLNYVASQGFNDEFILSTLRDFLRQQRLKTGIVEAAKLVQTGDSEGAETIILRAVSEHDAVFDKGLDLTDAEAVLRGAAEDEEYFRIGIPPFDERNICPSRKTLTTVMAPTNRGKSWMLTAIGKATLLQRYKVLHVTLEMSEKKVLKRYLQALFSFARHGLDDEKVRVRYMEFKTDKEGHYLEHTEKFLTRPALGTDAATRLIKKRLRTQYFARKFKLLIKEFPTASLTVRELSAYLDMLERHEKFVPDVLIVDYADLMHLNPEMIRVDTGRVYKELRGLAVQRNIAVVTASQSNRGGERARLVTMEHSAEDYSKMATSDLVFTYNQTASEKRLGLARIFSAKVRDERSGWTVVVSQAYELGQFARDSALLLEPEDYWLQLDAEDK